MQFDCNLKNHLFDIDILKKIYSIRVVMHLNWPRLFTYLVLNALEVQFDVSTKSLVHGYIY